MMTDAERLFRKYGDAELIVRRLEQSGALAANEHETLKWALRWAHLALYAEFREDDEQEPTEELSLWYRQKDPDLEKALKYLRDTQGCPACHSTNLDGGWVIEKRLNGDRYQKKKCKDCGTEWEERFVLGQIQRCNIFSPCRGEAIE